MRSAFSIKIVILLALVSICGGCQTYRPHTTAGGVLGGTTGGLIGAAIGNHHGDAGEGALIGAAVGAATGSLLGNVSDQEMAIQQQRIQQQTALARQNSVTIDQVVQMSMSGLSDDLIINEIRAKGPATVTNPNDLVLMKNSGVSDNVIATYQSGGRGAAAPAIYGGRIPIEPYPAGRPVFLPAPYPHGNWNPRMARPDRRVFMDFHYAPRRRR